MVVFVHFAVKSFDYLLFESNYCMIFIAIINIKEIARNDQDS